MTDFPLGFCPYRQLLSWTSFCWQRYPVYNDMVSLFVGASFLTSTGSPVLTVDILAWALLSLCIFSLPFASVSWSFVSRSCSSSNVSATVGILVQSFLPKRKSDGLFLYSDLLLTYMHQDIFEAPFSSQDFHCGLFWFFSQGICSVSISSLTCGHLGVILRCFIALSLQNVSNTVALNWGPLSYLLLLLIHELQICYLIPRMFQQHLLGEWFLFLSIC